MVGFGIYFDGRVDQIFCGLDIGHERAKKKKRRQGIILRFGA